MWLLLCWTSSFHIIKHENMFHYNTWQIGPKREHFHFIIFTLGINSWFVSSIGEHLNNSHFAIRNQL